MKNLILLLAIACSLFSNAQSFDERRTDNLILRIPEDQTTSTSTIAEFIKKNFDSDRKKVRAAYTWVTLNIKYSDDSANIINLGVDHEAKITVALRRRKGVCENFAAIFNDICLKSGLTGFVVNGYTRQNGVVDKTGHSWCAIRIDSNWHLCDPTWDATGSIDKYFLMPPSQMIETHMPYDPLWQLLDHPVSRQKFKTGNFYTDKKDPFFNYADTIAAFMKMDSLQKFRSIAYRIEHAGLDNNLVKLSHDQAKMNVEFIRQDKDVDLYNSSVADLNEARDLYNSFIIHRNQQFNPEIPDNELQLLLNGADKKIAQAHKKLDEIEKSQATFQIGTHDVRSRLNTLSNKVKEQKEFLTVYLNTPKASRQSLFFTKQVSRSEK